MIALDRHPVSAVAVSSDGKTVAAGFRDGSIAVWDVPAGRVIRAIPASKSASPAHGRGSSILHIFFVGSASEFVSADDRVK